MKTGIIYCRVSTKKQEQNGESLENQEKACRKYCENNNIQVLGVFKEAFTGKTKDRPTLTEAMNNAKINNASYFVVFDIDRFSREGFGAYSELKNKLSSFGTELRDSKNIIGDTNLVFENEHIDMSKYAWNKESSSEYAEVIMTTQAQIEGKKIIQRTIPREIQLEQEGYQVRQANYGYMNEKIKIDGARKTIQVKHPVNGEHMINMCKLRAEGYLTDSEIAEKLNIEGCRKKSGGKICTKYIQAIIKKPIYAGVIKTKWTGDKPIRAKYEGLVSIELWNKANRGKITIIEIDRNTLDIEYKTKKGETNKKAIRETRKDYRPEFPFSKHLECPICGKSLIPSSSRSKNGKLHYYYTCRGQRGNYHKNYGLKRDEVNDKIMSIIKKFKFKDEVKELMKAIAKDVYEEREKELKESKSVLISELNKLNKKEKEITESIGNILQFPKLLEMKNKELEEIGDEKSKLEIQIKNSEKMTDLDEYLELIENLLSHTHKLASDWEKPELVSLAINIIFGGKFIYENLDLHTPRIHELSALNSQIKNSQNGNLDGNTCWQAWTSGNLKNFEKYYDSLSSEIKEKFNRQLDKWEEIYNMALNRRMFGL